MLFPSSYSLLPALEPAAPPPTVLLLPPHTLPPLRVAASLQLWQPFCLVVSLDLSILFLHELFVFFSVFHLPDERLPRPRNPLVEPPAC